MPCRQLVMNGTHGFTSIVQAEDQDAVLIPLEHVLIEPGEQRIHPAPATRTQRSQTSRSFPKPLTPPHTFFQHQINK